MPLTRDEPPSAARFTAQKRRLIAAGLGFLAAGMLALLVVLIAQTAIMDGSRAVDASVRADVTATVLSVSDWEQQDSLNQQVVLDNAQAFADADVSNRVQRTLPKTIIGVYAPGDGSYTICGFNPDGVSYRASGSALGYDSTTGMYAPVSEAQPSELCDGALDSRGNDVS